MTLAPVSLEEGHGLGRMRDDIRVVILTNRSSNCLFLHKSTYTMRAKAVQRK